jgi:hypothetical protein
MDGGELGSLRAVFTGEENRERIGIEGKGGVASRCLQEVLLVVRRQAGGGTPATLRRTRSSSLPTGKEERRFCRKPPRVWKIPRKKSKTAHFAIFCTLNGVQKF